MLEYDNSAFYYFALSTISFYVIPSWYGIIKKLKKALFVKDEEIGALVRTSAEKEKIAELKRRNKGLRLLKTPGFVFNLLLTVFASYVVYFLILSVSEEGEIHSFDPFQILGVDVGAEQKEIKKAYRSLSLLNHPDKCPTKACEDMFIKVNKAYQCLTDPVAKENWEKYGNPDGKQSLEVSIGLPTLLLDSANRNVILLTYLVFMVIVIPAAVWKYYSDSSKFGEKNVMYDTYSWFHHSLSEHTIVKSLPETYAGSAEFRQRNLPTTKAERQEITKIMTSVKSLMQKPKINHPILLKGNVLLHAYLLRKVDILSESAKEDLHYMLRYSHSLVDAMISICQHQEWLQTATTCIQFGQFVTQGLWTKDSTLLQLPHFSDAEVKDCEKAKGASRAKTLVEYLNVPNSEKKGLSTLSEEQQKDVLKCCSIIPQLQVDSKVFVDDDEDAKVYEGDLLTIQITLTRTNLEQGEKASLVHAPRFPYPRKEAWWVLLGTKEGRIISVEKVVDPSRVVEHKIKFLAPKQGEYEFDLHVLSNAYIGLDQKSKVKLVTLDSSVLPEYKVHPDDAALDDEPTLFEEMLNANVEEDSDSDDDDSDDDSDEDGSGGEGAAGAGGTSSGAGGAIRELTAAEKKKQELRNARKKAAAAADDDDSDDDSDVEEVYEE